MKIVSVEGRKSAKGKTTVLTPGGQTYAEAASMDWANAMDEAKTFMLCECDRMVIRFEGDGYTVDVKRLAQQHILHFVAYLLSNETNFGLRIVQDEVNMLAVVATSITDMHRWVAQWRKAGMENVRMEKVA